MFFVILILNLHGLPLISENTQSDVFFASGCGCGPPAIFIISKRCHMVTGTGPGVSNSFGLGPGGPDQYNNNIIIYKKQKVCFFPPFFMHKKYIRQVHN